MRIAPAPPRAPATGAWGVGDGERGEASGAPGAVQRCSRLAVGFIVFLFEQSSKFCVCEDRRFDDLCGGASAQDDVRGSRVFGTQTCVDPGRPKS